MITQKGNFEEKYQHIDAPTLTRLEWNENHALRRLYLPGEGENIYANKMIEFLANNKWVAKRKLDGENIRIKWDGEQGLWNGKTNNFVCKKDFEDYMNETFIEEIFEEKFGRGKKVFLFGERMGPKVQGNELSFNKDEVVLFDVKVNNSWLDRGAIEDIAKSFNVRTCFDFMFGRLDKNLTLNELIKAVHMGRVQDWEGVVASPAVECYDCSGKRTIVKVKNKDYLC